MISAILAAKALKKLRGGEMFSVGASPFNSRSRQIYGGWTADMAGRNLWGLHKAYSMDAKYSTDPETAQYAKEWLRAYRKARKDNPVLIKTAMSAARRAAGLPKFYPKPLTPGQKDAIWNFWAAIPFNDRTPLASYRRSLATKAPYPPYGFLIEHPQFARPYMQTNEAISSYGLTADQMYREGPNMETPFFASAQQRSAFFKDPANARYKPIRVPRTANNVNTADILAAAQNPFINQGVLNREIARRAAAAMKDENAEDENAPIV